LREINRTPVAIPVIEHPAAILLSLVDLTEMVEGRASERRLHRGNFGDRSRIVFRVLNAVDSS